MLAAVDRQSYGPMGRVDRFQRVKGPLVQGLHFHAPGSASCDWSRSKQFLPPLGDVHDSCYMTLPPQHSSGSWYILDWIGGAISMSFIPLSGRTLLTSENHDRSQSAIDCGLRPIMLLGSPTPKCATQEKRRRVLAHTFKVPLGSCMLRHKAHQTTQTIP